MKRLTPQQIQDDRAKLDAFWRMQALTLEMEQQRAARFVDRDLWRQA